MPSPNLIIRALKITDLSPPGSRRGSQRVEAGERFDLLLLLSRFSHVQLRDTMDCSLSGSSVHEISQARVLEWVAIAFSRFDLLLLA